MNREAFINEIPDILDNIQESIFNRAIRYRKENTIAMDDKKQFYDLYQKASGYHNGAFVMAHWCGSDKCEETIKKDLPEGFQRSEFLLEHGFLDFIVDRKNLKDKLAQLVHLFRS